MQSLAIAGGLSYTENSEIEWTRALCVLKICVLDRARDGTLAELWSRQDPEPQQYL